jgi:type VI secretion system secreted protein VgrG
MRESLGMKTTPSTETAGRILDTDETKKKNVNAGGNMKRRGIHGLLLFSLSALSLYGSRVDLGTAGSFAVLGGTGVTNTGPTVIWGDLGVSPGAASTITGFPPGVISGTEHAADTEAANAQADALAAYDYLAGLTPTENLTGRNLGGQTLTPGVYKFDTTAGLTGKLTLDLQGDPNSLFVFQIGTTLTTASGSSVVTTDGTDCCNIFWQIGTTATLGSDTDFRGNILAFTTITLNSGAKIAEGRALALTAAVTLDTNNISNAGCDVPEPGTVPLLGAGLLGLLLLGRTSRKRAA